MDTLNGKAIEYVWTNTARFPSRLNERPFTQVKNVVADVGVPECAVAPLSAKVLHSKGEALTMTHMGGYSKEVLYDPLMTMSFRKDGVDYAQPNTVLSDHTIAVGRVHKHTCKGETTHLAWWPNCQNVAVLKTTNLDPMNAYPYMPHGFSGNRSGTGRGGGGYGGDGYSNGTAEVPVPASGLLFLTAVVVWWSVLVLRNLRKKRK